MGFGKYLKGVKECELLPLTVYVSRGNKFLINIVNNVTVYETVPV